MGAPQKDAKSHFKKGQHLYQAGERADRIFILTQGLVTVTMPGARKAIELYKATQPQILGEEAIKGLTAYTSSAVAVNDSTALVIPILQVKTFIETSAPQLKQLIFGMLCKYTLLYGELVNLKRVADSTACPQDRVAKLFTVIAQVAAYTGKRKDDVTTVSWLAYKKYCQRVFMESPVRLEQAMYMLVNLGFAQLEMVPDEIDPEAPMDLGFVHFRNLEEIIRFAQYYRVNYKNATSSEYRKFTDELELWNKNGQPSGMPEPVEAKKKRAS